MNRDKSLSFLHGFFESEELAAEFFNKILDKGGQVRLSLQGVRRVFLDNHHFLRDNRGLIADFEGTTLNQDTVLFNVQYLEAQEHMHGRLILELAAACNSIALHHTMVMVYAVQHYLIGNRPLQRLILQRRDYGDLQACIYAVSLDFIAQMLKERDIELSLSPQSFAGGLSSYPVCSAVCEGGMSM